MKVIFFFVFCVFNKYVTGAKTVLSYSVIPLKLECFNVNSKYIDLQRCDVTILDKGKRRLINYQARTKQPLTEFYDQFRLLYKTGVGKFMPHIVNLDLDGCKAADVFDSKNPIIGRIGKYFERFVPELRDGCPFKGTFNLSDFDLTADAYKYFPPGLLTGTYKIQQRLHFGASNRTLIESIFIAELKPK